jgi:RHS repeat-associated protein
MYDGDGKQTWSVEYDVYGKIRKRSVGGVVDCPFRYQGQYEDEETGLYYNRFRYYDANAGVYVSQDPIRLTSKKANLYSYVKDSNIWIDYFGLTPLPDDAIVVRGGTCKAGQFSGGSGVTLDADGKLQGVSVNSVADNAVEELAEGIPNGQVGVTTVGEIRAKGGDVVPSPTKNNPNHATMSGITPEEAEELFKTQKNPCKK